MADKLTQFELWAHGTRFVVRRVGAGHHWHQETPYCEPRLRMTAPAGYVLFGPHGFIARLPRRNLKRWAGHFGLKYLLKSVP